jgi:homoserine kinase
MSSVPLAGVALASVAAIAAVMAFRMKRVAAPIDDIEARENEQEGTGDADNVHSQLLGGAI